MAVALGRNLQAAPAPGHAIVGSDHTILLDAQHVGERSTGIGHEGRAGFCSRHRKARIVVGHETIFEIAVGGRDRLDPGQAQFLRQPVLQRPEHPFHAPARLGRIGRDVDDAELGERTADPLSMYLADVFTLAANMAGICGISIPCGFATSEGKQLPVGLQILGKALDEATILRVAHAYEQSTDWHRVKPKL